MASLENKVIVITATFKIQVQAEQRVVASGLNARWDIDLAAVSNIASETDGVKYIQLGQNAQCAFIRYSGIGAQTALHLAQYKPRLVLVARRQELLEKVAEQCKEKGMPKDKILVLPADLTKLEDLKKIVSETIERFGQLDVLVNNAATMTSMAGVDGYTPDEFDTTMSVNLKAPIFLSQAAVPYLKKTKGSIINISSTASTESMPFCTLYSVSKAGLDHFTNCLAMEMAPHGVRVNTIRPGMILTDTYASVPGRSEMLTAIGKASQPLKGIGESMDIAKVIQFLASDDSAFMTGESIYVDGGRHLMGASATAKKDMKS